MSWVRNRILFEFLYLGIFFLFILAFCTFSLVPIIVLRIRFKFKFPIIISLIIVMMFTFYYIGHNPGKGYIFAVYPNLSIILIFIVWNYKRLYHSFSNWLRSL
jgi:hypothetical protein